MKRTCALIGLFMSPNLIQVGFGWTNGVVLWIAKNYGQVLADPQCPPLLTTQTPPPPASPRRNAAMVVRVRLAGIMVIVTGVVGLCIL